MSKLSELQKDAKAILKKTSRTFNIPINFLEGNLKQAVSSAYLCMRAIDEIEDHPEMQSETKQLLLRRTADLLREGFDADEYEDLMTPYRDVLPEVTLRLGDWIAVCPAEIVRKVAESTAEMADGMAKWTERNWKINTKEDLDDYTYYVAGLVGVMLSDLWKWHANIEADRELAIGYGRGLQIVNILRNQEEDAERGVSYLPDGWSRADLFHYADENLNLAKEYMRDIKGKNRSITLFCKIPLALAENTLKVMKVGKEKMTRYEVESVVEDILEEESVK
ncbi:squalene/phytoene synthase family protein [Chungangia koreensis]|uniref:Squalene/phytoene synthase family protein n=1 Tax=Chungangia koreensis TaxID=752657 RepID=A0ABV8X504_9LACT